MKSVFISSTFRDMQAERDALTQIVLPDVAAEAEKHQEDVDFIDLRWGVDTSEMESEEGARKVLSVCLDEIEHARPYMIVLLGERYGWVPDQALIRQAAAEKDYEAEDDFKSVTALEIEFGALADGRQLDRCLFYKREGLDVSGLSDADAAIYGAESEKHREKLTRLTEKIEARIGHKIPVYTVEWDEREHAVKGLDAFCERVSADLKTLFEQEWKESEEKSVQEQSILESRRFFEKKASECVAVEDLLEEYESRINAKETSFFFLQGTSGCGKSTIMGRMAADFRDAGGDVFPFACGHTAQTGTTKDLLEQLVYYLTGLLGERPGEDPGKTEEDSTYSALRMKLTELIAKYADCRKDRTLYIMLDATEFLAGEGNVRFGWAPDILPDNVKIISCFTNDRKMDPPVRAKERTVRMERGSLTPAEAESIAQAVFARSHKQINRQLLERIVQLKPAESPLYLTLLVHRLMMLNSSDFGEIAELGNDMNAINAYLLKKIEKTPDTIEGLCRTVLAEAGARIDRNLADRVTKVLATPTHGLRERDVSAILEKHHLKRNALSFARLMKYLRPFFLYGSDGRIEYTHRIIRDAVVSGTDEKLRRMFSTWVWEYLAALPASDPICADYRAIYAWLTGNWQDLIRFVGSLHKDRDRRANVESLRYLATVTRSSSEVANRQIKGMLNDLEKYEDSELFVRKLAEELYAYYPQGPKAQESMQWVYEILLRYLEKYYEAGNTEQKKILLKEVMSCRMKLIRSYTETWQTGKIEQLLVSSYELLKKDAGEDPAYYGIRSTLHRYNAEYFRNNMASRADSKAWLYHCQEAERLAAAEPSGNLFGLINAKMLYCNALEGTNRFQEAKRKAEECIPLCEKYYQEKQSASAKKTLADAFSFFGQDCLFVAWDGKMDPDDIEQAEEAYEKAAALYEEVILEQRTFHTYLAAAGTYSGAAEAHIFAWSVCPEQDTAEHLTQAGMYLDKAGALISVTEEAIDTIRVKMDKYAWLSKRYAWYEVQKDKSAALDVYREREALGKEISARTGSNRYTGFLSGLGLRIPKRKKSRWFGRK